MISDVGGRARDEVEDAVELAELSPFPGLDHPVYGDIARPWRMIVTG